MKIEASFMCVENHSIVVGGVILPFLSSRFALLQLDNLFRSCGTVGIIRNGF